MTTSDDGVILQSADHPVEITPEMMQAGLQATWGSISKHGIEDVEAMLKAVFTAMIHAQPEFRNELPPFCDGEYCHSYRLHDGKYSCLTCNRPADRDPSLPCTHYLFGKHMWTGSDAKGLLCTADSEWNVASSFVCACGATLVPAQTG